MIYELIGIVGMDPGDMCLRDLIRAAKGKITQQWDHTAALQWMLYKTNADPKKGKKLKPEEFHPYRMKPHRKLTHRERAEFARLGIH